MDARLLFLAQRGRLRLWCRRLSSRACPSRRCRPAAAAASAGSVRAVVSVWRATGGAAPSRAVAGLCLEGRVEVNYLAVRDHLTGRKRDDARLLERDGTREGNVGLARLEAAREFDLE